MQDFTMVLENNAIATGLRIKRLRELAGLTRETLSEESQISRASISYWEHGKINRINPSSIARLVSIFKAHGVQCDEHWILTGKGAPPNVSLDPTLKIEPSLPNFSAQDKMGPAQLAQLLDAELELFKSFSKTAIIMEVEHEAMMPVFARGDFVGGFWQSSITLTHEKFCLVLVENKLQIRRVRPATEKGRFDLSFLTYDTKQSEPFEIRNLPLDILAPIIRIWR